HPAAARPSAVSAAAPARRNTRPERNLGISDIAGIGIIWYLLTAVIHLLTSTVRQSQITLWAQNNRSSNRRAAAAPTTGWRSISATRTSRPADVVERDHHPRRAAQVEVRLVGQRVFVQPRVHDPFGDRA